MEIVGGQKDIATGADWLARAAARPPRTGGELRPAGMSLERWYAIHPLAWIGDETL